MAEENLEQQQHDAVQAAAEALDVVWTTGRQPRRVKKQGMAAIEKMAQLFPGYPSPEGLIFDDETLRARPV